MAFGLTLGMLAVIRQAFTIFNILQIMGTLFPSVPLLECNKGVIGTIFSFGK